MIRKFLFSFLILFLTLILIYLSLLVAETYLKYVGLGDPVIYEKNNAFGYTLLPNQNKVRFNKSEVNINSSGLRSNSEWAVANNSNKIVFFGDSVTYGGSYIDNTKLFSEKVCKILNNSSICGNAGINSYGVLNMILRSRYDYRIADANIVVFTVIYGDFLRGITNYNVAHYYMNKPVSNFPGIEEAISYIGYRYDINRFISKKGGAPHNKKLNKISNLGGIDFALKNLNEEIDRLEKLGKKVFVFYSPSKQELEKNLNDNQIKYIKKNLNNIFDMTNFFKNRDVYYDGVHYNENGHELVSKIISSHITKKISFQN